MSDSEPETAWTEVRITVPLEGAADVYLARLEELCLVISPGGFVVEGDDAPPGDDPPPPP